MSKLRRIIIDYSFLGLDEAFKHMVVTLFLFLVRTMFLACKGDLAKADPTNLLFFVLTVYHLNLVLAILFYDILPFNNLPSLINLSNTFKYSITYHSNQIQVINNG